MTSSVCMCTGVDALHARPHLGAGVDVQQLRHGELGDGLRALGLGPAAAALLAAEAGLGEGLEVELVIALGVGRPPAHAAAEVVSDAFVRRGFINSPLLLLLQ